MTDSNYKRDISYTQNRELSWLEFNRRVLQEGCDERVPLLERLKFISIFTSNLDEFFMVRVGSLHDLTALKKEAIDNKTGWTPRKQLEEIYARMPEMYAERDAAFAAVERRLAESGLVRLDMNNLNKKDAAYLESYYTERVAPILSPLVIDVRHPFPHLTNLQLYLFSDLQDAKGNPFFGIVAVPSIIKPLIRLPGSSRYILTEDLLRDKMAGLFQNFRLKSLAVISVTRNADINLDEAVDDIEENIRLQFKKALKKRNRLAPVRLEVQGTLPPGSVKYLAQQHDLLPAQVLYAQAPLRMKYVFALEDLLDSAQRSQLCYRPFEPQPGAELRAKEPVLDQVAKKDALLHFPYESMEPFLRLLREASTDPRVISIKITIYRMASVSKVAEYLAQAAENGKEVLALMELRARFDEENNIDYSERLEQAGCTIIYGFEDYKVHSKVCLITYYQDDHIHTITQIGTGNYNEKTAKQYTDFSFLTGNAAIGADATTFFKNMLINNLQGHYSELLAAPAGIKPALMSLFDREIRRAKAGEPAAVFIKCNSISERTLIDKMMEASCAGVPITLLVRGICCIRPGIPGKTENIRVLSIVGRFLEHHRIYAFGAAREDIYISSADLMTRNIVQRVELAVPLRDADVREKILRAIDIFLSDDAKMKELQPDGQYAPLPNHKDHNAQQIFMQLAEQQARELHYTDELKSQTAPLHVEALGGKRQRAAAARIAQEEALPPEPPAPTAKKAEETSEKILEKKAPGLWQRLVDWFLRR